MIGKFSQLPKMTAEYYSSRAYDCMHYLSCLEYAARKDVDMLCQCCLDRVTGRTEDGFYGIMAGQERESFLSNCKSFVKADGFF